jgi:hypothetical protein
MLTRRFHVIYSLELTTGANALEIKISGYENGKNHIREGLRSTFFTLFFLDTCLFLFSGYPRVAIALLYDGPDNIVLALKK